MTDTATPQRTATPVRSEIQALRAVAVLLVVLYHLWPGRLPGGYVGVDVFFVISGFLITAHLAREASSTGRIRLGRFWARRARRLLPAAYVVLTASTLAIYLWVPQIHWVQNFREIIASGLYFQNWRLAIDAVDYLAAENAPSTAQHYWTLSVEEQFYLVWPLLILATVMLATRFGSRRSMAWVTAVLAVTTAVSFGYSWWLTSESASSAYFVTPTRAWEFGAGSLLALLLRERDGGRADGTSYLRIATSWTGFGALAYCGLVFSASTPFPGTAALLPVGATVAIIAAGAPTGVLSPMRLLGLRPVQWTGDISYAIYLWHWPPIVVLPYVLGHELGLEPRVGILAGTFVLAYLTKRLIEDPVRFGRRFGMRRSGVTFALSATAAAALVAVSLVGSRTAERASDRAAAISEKITTDAPECFGAASMNPAKVCDNPELEGLLIPDTTAVRRDFAYYRGCWSSNKSSRINDCTFGDTSSTTLPRVVLVGDSHARAMLPAFVKLAEVDKISVTAHLKGSCAWSRNPQPNEDKAIAEACASWRVNLNDWLEEHADEIDVIVTTALTTRNQSGSKEDRIAGFAEAWRPFTRAGIPVVAIKDNPYHDTDPNDCLATEREISSRSCALPRKDAFPNYDALPMSVERVKGAHLYDLTDYYCTRTTCPSVIGGVNVYRDAHHLTGTYTETMAPFIYERMKADGVLRRR